jgi:protein-S-isoprenylcysteine O-methyltransferase Ste14
LAALGSAVFFLVAPGVVGALVPWLLTDWHAGDTWLPLQVAGVALLIAGVGAMVYSFARFVTEGRGTPAPVAPTERLVVGGLYRYVRNPMYVALLAAIAGQALLLGRWVLLGYGAGVFLLVFSFVRLYEEPELERTYGEEYVEYRRAVPGWLPRPLSLRR